MIQPPNTPVPQRPIRGLSPGERVRDRNVTLNPNSDIFRPIGAELGLPDFSKLTFSGDPITPANNSKIWQWRPSDQTPAHTDMSRTPPSASTTELRTPSHQHDFSPIINNSLSKSRRPETSVFNPWDDVEEKDRQVSDLPGNRRMEQKLPRIRHSDITLTAHELGRYLMLSNVPRDVDDRQIKAMVKSFADFKAIIVKHLSSKGCVVVAFHDPRETTKLYEGLRNQSVFFKNNDRPLSLHCMKMERAIVEQNLLESIGDLWKLESLGAGNKSFFAEFFDARHARDAIGILDGTSISGNASRARYASQSSQPLLERLVNTLGSSTYIGNDVRQSIEPLLRRRNVVSAAQDPSTGHWPSYATENKDSHETNPSSDIFGPYIPLTRPFEKHASFPPYPERPLPSHLEAMSRRMSEPGTIAGIMNTMDISARSRLGQGLGRQWNPYDRQAIPEENRVFPERILSGLDPRTTVMIKDVPNKLSRDQLIDILHEVVPRRFDFVYLRFDFKNCCNVGYAFVNFVDVGALYAFIQAKVGKKWNLFSSEKVLQVSYANIQGKASLINKFRNSAVMGVIEQWRPKLFYSSGARQGDEEPFPEVGFVPTIAHLSAKSQPDNPFTRQRSAAARLSTLSTVSTSSFGIPEPDLYNYASGAFDSAYL
ncbi:hypothetical protein M231_02045 [Tremella mesenterica]|uniref:RRM domain-containing protein n=1 Tax=Tremella mesenterica TaxID=5217 RepID=A0A4Q1BRQ5_TREME|nr:hypothetical protein M231_02045 [Tremella mesenterica]